MLQEGKIYTTRISVGKFSIYHCFLKNKKCDWDLNECCGLCTPSLIVLIVPTFMIAVSETFVHFVTIVDRSICCVKLPFYISKAAKQWFIKFFC